MQICGDNGFPLYIVQGTNEGGNLDIERGQQINPGGYTNASDQEDWLQTYTDVINVNNDQTSPLWPMYPTAEGGEGARGTTGEGIRHPGVRFDQLYDGSPHATQDDGNGDDSTDDEEFPFG
jgi:hypothetical protein